MALIPLALLMLFGATPALAPALADDQQPYIDQIRKELKEDEKTEPAQPSEESSEPYIDSLKKKMKPRSSSEGYTEKLKKELEAEEPAKKKDAESFIERQKEKLGPKKEEGAIEDFKKGKKLHPVEVGKIHHAAGFSITLDPLHRTITSPNGHQNFGTLYGTGLRPDIGVFYEFQPFHSRWLGNFGIIGSAEFAYFQGTGVFQYQLTNPVTNTPFPAQSQTQFSFFYFPVSLGLDYRINFLRILRPFAAAQATDVGYVETRNDGGATHFGDSRGVLFTAGVSLFLDWIDPRGAWNLYAEQSIHHYYLTAEVTQLSTFSGDVNFNVSNFMVGFTFEF